MTKTATIIRFDPNGSNGLEEWEEMAPSELVSEMPLQRGHLYHELENKGYMVGAWDCTPVTLKMMPYPVDEYMLFLEGGLTMVLPDGTELEINAGDAYIIPKGFVCQWRQPVYLHKFFMILDGPVPEANNSSLRRITLPDLTKPEDDVDLFTSRTDFLNAAGTMRVDVRNFGAMSQPSMNIIENMLISVLEGMVSLNDGEAIHDFKKGETAYVHQGDAVGWATTARTRVVIASYADRD